jgi:electron-transferring-flavoprotein dehydrogenase
MGVARDGSHKDNYTPGIALTGKYAAARRRGAGLAQQAADPPFSLDAESGPQK